ncbi:MAG: class I SAM-dependent methyltransferase [bacterium]|nr:class I SAM-dependent methyltransferase [bacterium]
MPEESERVEAASNWYKEQLDIDVRLIEFRYRTWVPHIRGDSGLELGSGDGQMTKFLVKHFSVLMVVDGAQSLLDSIPEYSNVKKVHCLFEEFEPPGRFDTVFLEHILEHVENPVELLIAAKGWLVSGGRLLLGVPNGHSLHRLAATKMGLLQHPCELNQRDVSQGHRRVYTPDTFKKDLEAAGLSITAMGGVFLKPLSNQQIQDTWTTEMIEAFYELGKEFPLHTADIYAVCE